MKNVSKITCENGAGFVQEFRVVWKEGEHTRVSDWTSGRYPNPQSKTVELSQFGIPVGAEVWVEVHAIAGKQNKLVIMWLTLQTAMMLLGIRLRVLPLSIPLS